MNVVCLNCQGVRQTEDPRAKFCGKICRNRYNVKRSRDRKKAMVSEVRPRLDDLRAMIKGIEAKKPVAKVQATQPIYNDAWQDPVVKTTHG